MRKALLTLVLLFVFLITYSQSLTPRQLYPGLFEAVQLADIFPDNKILDSPMAEARISTSIRVFDDSGKLMEKYNVLDTGSKAGGDEYPLQDGFGVDHQPAAQFAKSLPG
ncbi:trehalase family glycosidase [Mucilaginibacter sp. 22184]|uniref:trehalase family glycosidase n=1 Tax=Mucilaginibacter sp. 22184 TaxID=3453887 RepID=UPI003F8442B3